jgi:phosphatidylserine decarboxylase
LNRDPYVPGWSFKKLQESTILATTISTLIVGVLTVVSFQWSLLVIFLICLTLMTLVWYFFRDPVRDLARSPDIFYSPGDGVVSDITTVRPQEILDQEFIRIGIFLSVFDVHIQRAAISGEIKFITHQLGKNLPAYDPGASLENDQIIMGLDTKYGLVLIKQIAGILARKCVNYARAGEEIKSGQRYGLIKFGSRVELYLPVKAKILCQIGDKVQAGLTGLAVYEE